MSKLSRFTQNLFGTSDTGTNFSQFGAFAASSPSSVYTGAAITPALIQALSNFATGWKGAVIGNNSPLLEDLNSLCFLFAYQLTYLMQAGIPEYDASTIYYTGSFCQVSGVVYRSLTDTNTGNTPASSPTNWVINTSGTVQTKSIAYQMLATDSLCIISGGNAATLPDATTVSGMAFEVVTGDANASNGAKTLSNQTINGVNCTSTAYAMAQQYQFLSVRSDGSNWWIVSAG